MPTRILHCGKSIENYDLCLKEEVAGFTRRGPAIGDTIYFAVTINDKVYCGMRGSLAETTDFKPWPDNENYVISFMLENVNYSKPFNIKFLSKIGGKYWHLRYLQGAKIIKEEKSIEALAKAFEENIIDEPKYLGPTTIDEIVNQDIEADDIGSSEENVSEIIQAIPEEKISIMGTFQTIKFKNETDKCRGIESLVNENFYSLFPYYTEVRSLLIPENRLFISSGIEARGEKAIRGIKSIPDALLIVYNKKAQIPIQINLIEYECFGESKVKSQDKSNYLNGNIIPQLMRFASSFSIVTDKQIREQTIKKWVDKIIQYIFDDRKRQEKFTKWIKEMKPTISDQLIGREIDKILSEALKANLKIVLIIDDLSAEQKDTITNVIRAFRLENGESINFLSYIVRLEQKISITDSEAEYALSVQ